MAAAESPRRGHGSAEAAALQGGAAASVLASALGMAPATACELCGLDLGGDHSDCRALEARLDADAKRRDEALIAEFKLRRITSENCAGFDAAVRTVARAVGNEVAVDASRAFEAEGWWFVPYGWIGCSGHIVEKASGEVNRLGSAFPLSLCFWAQERGALKSPCTLVVDRVHDSSRARDLLAEFDNRSPFNPAPIQGRDTDGTPRWLKPDELLAALPFKVQSPSLWFALPSLKNAEETGAFDFHVE